MNVHGLLKSWGWRKQQPPESSTNIRTAEPKDVVELSGSNQTGSVSQRLQQVPRMATALAFTHQAVSQSVPSAPPATEPMEVAPGFFQEDSFKLGFSLTEKEFGALQLAAKGEQALPWRAIKGLVLRLDENNYKHLCREGFPELEHEFFGSSGISRASEFDDLMKRQGKTKEFAETFLQLHGKEKSGELPQLGHQRLTLSEGERSKLQELRSSPEWNEESTQFVRNLIIRGGPEVLKEISSDGFGKNYERYSLLPRLSHNVAVFLRKVPDRRVVAKQLLLKSETVTPQSGQGFALTGEEQMILSAATPLPKGFARKIFARLSEEQTKILLRSAAPKLEREFFDVTPEHRHFLLEDQIGREWLHESFSKTLLDLHQKQLEGEKIELPPTPEFSLTAKETELLSSVPRGAGRDSQMAIRAILARMETPQLQTMLSEELDTSLQRSSAGNQRSLAVADLIDQWSRNGRLDEVAQAVLKQGS